MSVMSAAFVILCGGLSVIFGWATVKAVQREDRRRARDGG